MSRATSCAVVSVAALVAAAFAVSSVNAHAKLDTPTAWNPNPSKTDPCGGGPQLSSQASWGYNSSQMIQWTTVAGDGLGYICAYVDVTGSAAPSVTTTASTACTANTPPCAGPTVTNVGANTICLLYTTSSTTNPNPTTTVGAQVTYWINPPVTTCTSCTVVVFSSSSWWACTTVAIAEVAPPTLPAPTIPADDTTLASGLTFCTMLNGMDIDIPIGALSISEIDGLAKNTYTANLASPLVFNTPTLNNCPAIYQSFICFQTFTVVATPGGVCSDFCTQMNNACNVQTIHQILFDLPCTNYPEINCVTAAVGLASINNANAISPGQAFGYFVLAAVLAVVVFGGIIAVVIKVRSPATFDRYTASTVNCFDDLAYKLGCGRSASSGKAVTSSRSNMI